MPSTAKPAPRFHVGQMVLLHQGFRSGYQEVPIVRVGRKNAYIGEFGREIPFNMETGHEVRSANAPGVGAHIVTREQHAENKRRNGVIAELRALGIEGAMGRPLEKYSVDALTSVVNLLRDDLGEVGR